MNRLVTCFVKKAGFEPRTLGTKAERYDHCATRPVDTSPKQSTLYFEAKSEKKMCRSWIFATPDYTDAYAYILVHTRTYWYILVHTRTCYHRTPWCTSNQAGAALAMTYCLCCTLVPCIAHRILPFWSFFGGQASQAGHATPKLPQPRVDLIDIAAPLSVRCSRVGTAIRKAWILALAEHVRGCWGLVTSQKQWVRGTLPTIFWTSAR